MVILKETIKRIKKYFSKMDKNTRDFLIVIGSIAVGVIGGATAAAIIEKYASKKCHNCSKDNKISQDFCVHCGSRLG